MSRLKLAGQAGALVLVASLLVLLTWKVIQNDKNNVAQDFTSGKRPMAVDFNLERLNGPGSLRLSSLRGKVVVINFWAAWCDPCKSEAPRFQSAFERYRGRVAFVGVDANDFSGDARAFLDALRRQLSERARPGRPRPPRLRRAADSAHVRRRALGKSPRLHLRRGARGRARERDRGGACGVRILLVAALAVLALAAAPPAFADESHPTSAEIEAELWCKDCQTTLDQTNSGSSREIVRYLQSLIAAGQPKSEIKEKVVDRYGWRLQALPAKVEPRTTLADLEGEVMCPVCNTTLDQSSSPAARQIKTFISQRIAAGDSKDEIKDLLVAEYGPQILAAPPKKGFDLLAWLLPIVGVLGGAVVLAMLAWRWSRDREPVPAVAGLDPATERRIDQELARFDEG